MAKPLVLSLCDYTGNMVRPWAEAGYECWIVDIEHVRGVGEMIDGVRKVGADVTLFCPPLTRDVAFCCAFPPCTHLAASGARYFKIKGLDLLAQALQVVAACNRICEASGAPFFVENPVSTLSTYWRDPNYRFDPSNYAGYLPDVQQYDEAYTKETWLWTGGGFVMPPPKPVAAVRGSSKILNVAANEERAARRSVTPKGFAKAVFEANKR